MQLWVPRVFTTKPGSHAASPLGPNVRFGPKATARRDQTPSHPIVPNQDCDPQCCVAQIHCSVDDRLGEVRTATFDQFNLDLAIWTKQAAYTKQRRIHRVPISHEAVALIRLRREIVPKGCPFLFPGDVPDQPVGDPKRFCPKM